MKLLGIIKEIFLIEKKDQGNRYISVNATEHYANELGDVYFDEVCIGGEYSLLDKKIERYKYYSDRHISTELVEVLSKCVDVSKVFGEHDDWIVVPIPMHWSRYFLRGFHHTDLLAKQLGDKLHLSVISMLGTIYTKRQAKLSRSERILNKKNSFFIKNGYTVPSHIILVDDVVSSGSTLNEAAKTLQNLGVQKILCFTLASNAPLCQNLSKLSEPKRIT